MFLEEQAYVYDADRFLIVAAPLPMELEIEASESEPFLAAVLHIDPAVVSELVLALADEAPVALDADAGVAVHASAVTEGLRSALIRLLRAVRSPVDSRILAPTLVREILYFVLRSDQGAQLRALAPSNSQAHRVTAIIQHLDQHYEQPFNIPTLAQRAGMSESVFHQAFKTVTLMSPLQYIKRIRLHRARIMIVGQGLKAGEAAFKVGYANASQFSREFKRLFGVQPSRAADSLRYLQPPRADH